MYIQRALVEIALTRLKLARARLMMRGKGDTYQERNGACAKVQRVIIRVDNGAYFTPSKRGTHQGWKVSHKKWVFVDGKGAFIRYYYILLKGKLSEVKRGTYHIWKEAMTRYEKGHLCEWKKGTCNKGKCA